LLGTQQVHPCCRQLERERDAIQAPAYLGHRRGIGLGDQKARLDRGCTLSEQDYRLVSNDLLERFLLLLRDR
jgi:hypothetical protein